MYARGKGPAELCVWGERGHQVWTQVLPEDEVKLRGAVHEILDLCGPRWIWHEAASVGIWESNSRTGSILGMDGLSQWEEALLCNTLSHWLSLSPYPAWSLTGLGAVLVPILVFEMTVVLIGQVELIYIDRYTWYKCILFLYTERYQMNYST